MSTERARWKSLMLNVVLVGLGLVALVLLYALVIRGFSSPVDPTRDENPAGLVGEIIQVEVRNGCGVSGLAGEMTQFLRKRGFDVVEVGDYTSFDQAHTLVIDRVGDPASAKKVADALGLSEDRIVQEIRQDYYLDASVVIGLDYATLLPFQEQ